VTLTTWEDPSGVPPYFGGGSWSLTLVETGNTFTIRFLPYLGSGSVGTRIVERRPFG